MRRAVSIHIGVNEPGGQDCKRAVLKHSEDAAWRMAVLASQAGYESLQVLRGRAATRLAVHDALAGAAGQLEAGDNLLVTFSGHGAQGKVAGVNEPRDESWCLYDADLLDDKLAGYWRLFEPGVRIVVVSESCFSGGMGRAGEECKTEIPEKDPPVRMRDGGMSAGTVRMRGGLDREADPGDPPVRMRGAYDSCDDVLGPVDRASSGGRSSSEPIPGSGGPAVPCITEPARDALAIRAKVLLLTASGEREAASDGVFTCALLRLWDDSRFGGTYCELYDRVSQTVMAETGGRQQPQILIAGAAGPEFSLETAFHVDRDRALYAEIHYRGKSGDGGGWRMCGGG
jgi:hypothetical protein